MQILTDPISSNPFSLDGRVAIITGATRGIGASTARHFVAAGAKVAITHRGTERNERLSEALIAEAQHVVLIAASPRPRSGDASCGKSDLGDPVRLELLNEPGRFLFTEDPS